MDRHIIEEELVDVMNISLDAFTEDAYKKIRGANLKKVTTQVHNLINERDKASSNLKVQVNCIDQLEVKDEIEDFKEYWESYADNVLIRTYYDATVVTGETGGNITGKQTEFEEIDRWPCQQFWRRFNITEEGFARFCVDDWFNKSKIGDLHIKSISEIWQGKKYNRLREIQLENKYKMIPYCYKCTEWQGMKWDYDYFVAMEKLLGKKLL